MTSQVEFMENFPVGICILENNYRISYWNKRMESWVGISADELIGEDIREIFPHFSKQHYQERLALLFEGGSTAVFSSLLHRTLFPSIIESNLDDIHSTTATSRASSSGAGYQVVFVVQDVTSLYKRTQELHQSMAVLQSKTLELEELSKSKSSFLANMSHEIRTPLNGIIGMTDLLMRTKMTEEQEKYINIVHGCGDVLLTLIEDILDFSKIESGEVKIVPEPACLYSEMKELMAILYPRSVENNIEFSLSYDSSISPLIMDVIRIKQIIINIAGNALKFSKNSFVTISVNKLEETPNDMKILFEVKDGGIGISETQLENIFDRFIQADSLTTKRFGGTGLGLSIAKSLIELMGGAISVESEIGKGSKFSFDITLSKQDQKKLDFIPEEEQVTIPKHVLAKKVLIIDDFKGQCEIISAYLTSWNIKNNYVTSGQEGLDELDHAYYQDEPYDLVLADYIMPGMDGEQLISSICSETKYKDLKLIMLTGMHKIGDTQNAKNMGFISCLPKPVYPPDLLDGIINAFKSEGEGVHNNVVLSGEGFKKEQRTISKFKANILLVEDTKVNQIMAELMLEEIGCNVDIADNGIIALDLFQKNNYDLIFMDCRMPEMDGYEATREIRKLQGGKDIPIVAMTANAMDKDKEKCLDAGMNDYISKPTKSNNIEEILHKYLSMKKTA